jgi:hypothetical protein
LTLTTYQTLKNYDSSKLERLPQTIAKKQLKKPMEKIIQLLYLSCRANNQCSEYISKHYRFFLDLAIFYPEEITILLLEITSNIRNITEDESSIKMMQINEN